MLPDNIRMAVSGGKALDRKDRGNRGEGIERGTKPDEFLTEYHLRLCHTDK